ncbi:type IV toxin-antitoxin system AbiEi family antitoxin domain-containing protein [Nocardioides sp. LHD-245]|uniref:type IV toxin-antitoxin system AbiEi family antitoxin domain-containing protein n=1 Tax=Nocardioides sp. LHD-245 TaxID=3051387 RepID=UPI003709881C
MDPRVEAAIAANHGVISRAQALDFGVGPSAVRALLRDRVWVVVRRGVYTTRSIWEALDEYVARPLRKSPRVWWGLRDHGGAA